MDTTGSPYGLWVNKGSLVTLGFSFSHTLEREGTGWHLTVSEPGVVLMHFADGSDQTIAVDRGDRLLATGEHLYFALQRPAGTPLEGARGPSSRPREHHGPIREPIEGRRHRPTIKAEGR